MGSVDFTKTYIWFPDAESSWSVRSGPVNAQEAFSTLHSEIGQEYGHSYSGQLSSTSLYQVDDRPVTLAQAQARMRDEYDSMDKGECRAVALLEETPEQWEQAPDRDQVITISVPADVYEDHDRLRDAIARHVKVHSDEVNGWSVQRGPDRRPDVQVTATTKTVAPKGKTETRYFAIQTPAQAMPKWEDGHPSQAAARTALEDLLNTLSNTCTGPFATPTEVTGEVISMTRRVTGEPLATGKATRKKITARVKVTFRTKVQKGSVGTKQGGWFFYGCAPH